MIIMTPTELESLMEESRQIMRDWESYLQFRRKREVLVKELIASEGVN